MPTWNTEEMVELFSDLGYRIVKNFPGGDYDTRQLIVETPVHLYISGFDPQNCLTKKEWDNCDHIQYVELMDQTSDSSGGLCTDDEATGIAYLEIKRRLRKKGFTVINHYHEIF